MRKRYYIRDIVSDKFYYFNYTEHLVDEDGYKEQDTYYGWEVDTLDEASYEYSLELIDSIAEELGIEDCVYHCIEE